MCLQAPPKLIHGFATLALLATVCSSPAFASGERWQDSLVFDACEQRSFAEAEVHGTKTTVPFRRHQHMVKAGTSVTLTIRYPRLFTRYRVLVEVQEVPDALPFIRGTDPLPSVGMQEEVLAVTKGAQDITNLRIEPVTIESVLRGFLARESARQLILQIAIDRQKIIDGARTVAADLRELREGVGPVLGDGTGGRPHDRVLSLTAAFARLRRGLDVPPRDFCTSHPQERHVTTPGQQRRIRERVEETSRLAVNHRRIGERWREVRADGLFDRVIRDGEDLDTRMNEFLGNLHAHSAALALLDELIRENEGPRLGPTTLQDRWVLDFDARMRERYPDLRTDEEFRAIAERFREELAGSEEPHIQWLERFGSELQQVLDRNIEGLAPAAGREEPAVAGDSASVTILRSAEDRLREGIELAASGGTPNLRSAVRIALDRVGAARARIEAELSELNAAAAKLFDGINRILAHRRGPEIELSLGVYNRNAVVTYRVFEQTSPEPYAVVPATAPEGFAVPEGGGARGDEAGAVIADAPGEGFRFVGETVFEVHRTHRLAAFGGFTWTWLPKEVYKVREVDDKTVMPVMVGGSSGHMSYVVGVKSYVKERDLFPGADNGQRLGVVIGVPVNRMPGLLVGLSWEPVDGADFMSGVHLAKYPRLDGDIMLGKEVTVRDAAGFSPVHYGHEVGWFVGVSFDSNIFSRLFGTVAKIGGVF